MLISSPNKHMLSLPFSSPQAAAKEGSSSESRVGVESLIFTGTSKTSRRPVADALASRTSAAEGEMNGGDEKPLWASKMSLPAFVVTTSNVPPLRTRRVVFSPDGLKVALPKIGRTTFVMLKRTDASRTTTVEVPLEQRNDAFFTAGWPLLWKSSTAMSRSERLPAGRSIGMSHDAGEPTSGTSGQPTCSSVALDESQRTMIVVGLRSPCTIADSRTVEVRPSFTRTGDSRGDRTFSETTARVGSRVGTEVRKSAFADGCSVGKCVGNGVGRSVGLPQQPIGRR